MATSRPPVPDVRQRQFASPAVQTAWRILDCGFGEVADVFADCAAVALSSFSAAQRDDYLATASYLGKLGRGPEPMLVFLEEWPEVVAAVGATDHADVLATVMAALKAMQKSPNSKAIVPFLQSLAAVARRLQSPDQLHLYVNLALDLMARTSVSIHGHHTTFPSAGLPAFLQQAPFLLSLLALDGLRRWTDYGIRNYGDHPEQQVEYFELKSADSKAVLQRERHGTLFLDVERQLGLYLRALWSEDALLVPYSTAFESEQPALPYYDRLGMRVPDVLDDIAGLPVSPASSDTARPPISGLDRYRALLAHMAGHRRYSSPLVADNWSPLQRMAVETFEDARIDCLLIREYSGLGCLLRALHPAPAADACDPETTSCLRHRLTRLSRCLIDPAVSADDPVSGEFVRRFHTLIADGPSSTLEISALALSWAARTRRQSDQYAKVHFADTVVEYRDDNRHLWKFIEAGDEEETFEPPRQNEPEPESPGLPPRHYPEWDAGSKTYRPDWVSVYEGLHPSGQASEIDALLEKNAALAKQLRRVLDLLKPQDKVRIRYQEDGSDLDLDVALRSLIELKSGVTPDTRINQSHRTNGRDIAVLLLLDLSESLNEKVAGSANGQTVLQLSQEAVSLLAWVIDYLGDSCAIAGFHSNTRHEVRYQHLKGFSEPWGDEVKARLAAMQAGWSTRMGGALRHAAHYLAARPADKKLLLVLTDGRPADVDVPDDRHLIEDAGQAVKELNQQGIFSYCISLDPNADAYVSDIFDQRFTVIDNIQRLPERLPELFVALTK